MGGTALGASGRSNNGLKLDVKTGKLSLWRLFPTFTFTFTFTGLPGTHSLLVGGTALGASGRSNNGLKLDVKTGKLSLWRLFPTFTFTFDEAQLAVAGGESGDSTAGAGCSKGQTSRRRGGEREDKVRWRCGACSCWEHDGR